MLSRRCTQYAVYCTMDTIRKKEVSENIIPPYQQGMIYIIALYYMSLVV